MGRRLGRLGARLGLGGPRLGLEQLGTWLGRRLGRRLGQPLGWLGLGPLMPFPIPTYSLMAHTRDTILPAQLRGTHWFVVEVIAVCTKEDELMPWAG